MAAKTAGLSSARYCAAGPSESAQIGHDLSSKRLRRAASMSLTRFVAPITVCGTVTVRITVCGTVADCDAVTARSTVITATVRVTAAGVCPVAACPLSQDVRSPPRFLAPFLFPSLARSSPLSLALSVDAMAWSSPRTTVRDTVV